MKVVINNRFGVFGLSEYGKSKLPKFNVLDNSIENRSNKRLVKLVSQNPNMMSGWCSSLQVVEVPDDITDYQIIEYDGKESVLYVIDGKIHFM